MKIKFFNILLLSLLIYILASCNTNSTKPISSVTSTPTVTVSLSPSPVQTPSVTNSITPTPSTSLPPTPTPLPTLTPLITPTPTPIITGEISGYVYDDEGKKVENVNITAKSLNSEVNFYQTTQTDVAGFYKLTNVPANAQIEISTYKAGYVSKKRVESLVIRDNKAVNIKNANFEDSLAVSSKPEVQNIEFEEENGLVKVNSSIKIYFSESMDKNSVENSFAIISDREQDYTLPIGVTLSPANITGFKDGNNNIIFDIGVFNTEWKDGDKTLILKFREGYQFPSSYSDSIRYRIILTYTGRGEISIKDTSGYRGREASTGSYLNGVFFVNNRYQPYYTFTVGPDKVIPEVSSIYAFSEEGGASYDNIKITFSKIMRMNLSSGKEVTGGADGNKLKAVAINQKINNAADVTPNYKINGISFNTFAGASVTFIDYKTILLSVNPGVNMFNKNDEVEVTIGSNIVDISNKSLTKFSYKTIAR